MRTVLLGLLGVVLAVAIGVGIHLVTRETIALPVVRLDQGAQLAPVTATTTTATSSTTTTDTDTETDAKTDAEAETEGEDNSGSGSDDSGRGRGRGGDD